MRHSAAVNIDLPTWELVPRTIMARAWLMAFWRMNLPKTVFRSGWVPHVLPSVHGPKTDFSNAFTHCTRTLALGRSLFARVTEALEGAAPVFIGPCTLRRTWGTRPGRRASFLAPTSTTRLSKILVLAW